MDSMERSPSNAPFAVAAGGDARSVSSLVLGFRFFALAAVAGTVGFLSPPARSYGTIVVGVLLASLLAWLQTLRLPRALASAFPLFHVGSWSLLIHATGDSHSPLVLGYLLELPLSGASLGRTGVATAAVAAIALHILDVLALAPPLDLRLEAMLAAVVTLCAAITWKVLAMIESRRAEIEGSRRRLA